MKALSWLRCHLLRRHRRIRVITAIERPTYLGGPFRITASHYKCPDCQRRLTA